MAVYDIVDLTPVYLGHDTSQTLTYTVLEPPSGDATLRSLLPETGELVPEFSPDRLDVPPDRGPMRSSSSPFWRSRPRGPAVG